jgi:hypothetical protein
MTTRFRGCPVETSERSRLETKPSSKLVETTTSATTPIVIPLRSGRSRRFRKP